MSATAEDALAVATARALVIDMVEHRGQGHPGTALSIVPILHVLYSRVMSHHAGDPAWFDRDRFVLSSGHAVAALYAVLHLQGYDVSLDDLRTYRRFGSRAPGHAEQGRTPGVDLTTGALGQGFAAAVGMATAEEILRERLGEDVCRHRTFVLAGDGDLQEGVSHEAASLAGHWRLGSLTCVWNSNDLTLDGPASATGSDDVIARFRAYGWRVIEVADVEDLDELEAALSPEEVADPAPALVVVRTRVGFPSPGLSGSRAAHGAPLGTLEAARTKEVMGRNPDTAFDVPVALDEARGRWARRGLLAHDRWSSRVSSKEGEVVRAYLSGAVDIDLHPDFGVDVSSPAPRSPRDASQGVVTFLYEAVPALVVGSADLAGATGTSIAHEEPFSAHRRTRQLAFGIREHGMAAIGHGIAVHGGLRPVISTYLAFSDYLRPALRLAAISRSSLIVVVSHDRFDGAEDGPTHHAIEHITALRTMPGVEVYRPADPSEVGGAWRAALARNGPTVIVLSREPAPPLAGTDPAPPYAILQSDDDPELTIAATGADVHDALTTARILRAEGVRTRVVSIPRAEEFFRLSETEIDAVLRPSPRTRCVAMETTSRRSLADLVNLSTVESLGESGSASELSAWSSIDPESIARRAHAFLEGRQR